jgi:uracil-DNA glycosylase
VLCSAPEECGKVVPNVEKECRQRYLDPQLKLFPGARIVALGCKAWRRLKGKPGVKQARHPAHRGKQRDAEASWRRAVERDDKGSWLAPSDMQPEVEKGP